VEPRSGAERATHAVCIKTVDSDRYKRTNDPVICTGPGSSAPPETLLPEQGKRTGRARWRCYEGKGRKWLLISVPRRGKKKGMRRDVEAEVWGRLTFIHPRWRYIPGRDKKKKKRSAGLGKKERLVTPVHGDHRDAC